VLVPVPDIDVIGAWRPVPFFVKEIKFGEITKPAKFLDTFALGRLSRPQSKENT
jgi:hypothetical protein